MLSLFFILSLRSVFLNKKPQNCIRILAVGDIIGRPGRRLLGKTLPALTAAYDIDGTVVNVENAAGGFGMTRDIYREFDEMGIDCQTSGNHIFDKKGYEEWILWAPKLLRPENFTPGSAGKGFGLYTLGNGVKIGVVNLIARTFMKPYDCPFRAAEPIVEALLKETPIVLVDFHGEATSEKMAMGWFLAGRVSAVWGTHTHVPTADARILNDHTGYITDLGMTGPYDSIIGMNKHPVIRGFLTLGRTRFEVAKDDVRLGGCLFDIDQETGRCAAVEGVFLSAAELQNINRGTDH